MSSLHVIFDIRDQYQTERVKSRKRIFSSDAEERAERTPAEKPARNAEVEEEQVTRVRYVFGAEVLSFGCSAAKDDGSYDQVKVKDPSNNILPSAVRGFLDMTYKAYSQMGTLSGLPCPSCHSHCTLGGLRRS